MNKKIKVIDLLNKIANGEEVPKKIKVKENSFVWEVSENGTGYFNTDQYTGYDWLENYISLDNAGDLNTEVEILEDNTEEIEELKCRSTNYFNMLSEEAKVRWLYKYIQEDEDKINELVKAVKELRKDNNND